MRYIFYQNLDHMVAENCGIAILNPGWIHPKRNLDTSVLLFGKKSDVRLEEESEELNLEPNTSVLLAAGKTHQGAKKLLKPASYYWIHFSSPELPYYVNRNEAKTILGNREIASARLQNALLIPQSYSFSQPEIIKEDFHELLYEQEHPSFSKVKYQTLFKLMMVKMNEAVLQEYLEGDTSRDDNSLINAIIQKIYENLTDSNFSVKMLGQLLQYNPDYLERLFKSVMKKSIIEFIIDKRIYHATTILIDNNDTISSVAAESGFSSTRNFIRQFKSRTGLTPTGFRMRHKTMHITNV